MKIEELKKIQGLEGLADEVLTAIQTATEAEVTEAHRGTTNKTLSDVDALIVSLFGIEKQSGEKTTELVTRAAKAYKDQTTDHAKGELAELKTKLKEAEANGAKKEDIEKLQTSLLEKETSFEKLKTEYETELNTLKRNSHIDQVKAGITFNKDIDKEFLDMFMERADSQAREVQTVERDGVVYASKDGVVPIIIDDKNQTFNNYVAGLYGKITAKETPTGNNIDSNAGQTKTGIVSGKTQLEAFKNLEESKEYQALNLDEQRAKRVEQAGDETYKSLPKY